MICSWPGETWPVEPAIPTGWGLRFRSVHDLQPDRSPPAMTNQSHTLSLRKTTHFEDIWCLPEIGVPPVIIHFRWGFSILNQPFWISPHIFRTQKTHRNTQRKRITKETVRTNIGNTFEQFFPFHGFWCSPINIGIANLRSPARKTTFLTG